MDTLTKLRHAIEALGYDVVDEVQLREFAERWCDYHYEATIEEVARAAIRRPYICLRIE